jgi:ABC-type Fe3+/spermidine/putrescine transport system ATPase subunit
MADGEMQQLGLPEDVLYLPKTHSMAELVVSPTYLKTL